MQLGQRQQRTLASAITILSAVVILAAVLGIMWLLAVFLQTFSHVFLPLAVAGIGALVCQPYYNWLRKTARLATPLAIAAMFLTVLIPLGLFLGFFGMVIGREVAELVEQIPGWWQQLQERWPDIKQFFEENPWGKKASQVLEGQGPLIAGGLEYVASTTVAAGVGVAHWIGALLSWAVAPVYFVFFLIAQRRTAGRLESYLPFLKAETREDVVFLAREFVNIIVAFFRGQLVIAFLQGVLYAIGFSLVGLQYGLVLGFVLGFLNIIPYLGSMIGLGITLPLAYFQEGGGLLTLMGVIIVLLVVQTIEGYLLTPKIMGNRTGLHPMAIIFAVFFWGTALGGIMGMILAIPLTAFLVIFWRLSKEKYISELL